MLQKSVDINYQTHVIKIYLTLITDLSYLQYSVGHILNTDMHVRVKSDN